MGVHSLTLIISCSVRMVRNIRSFIYAHLHINSIGHFRVPSVVPLFQSESECENHCYENDFYLHENETACRIHFHMKGFDRT